MAKRKVAICYDSSGDGAVYVGGKIIYAGHYCTTDDMVNTLLEALNCEVEDIEVSSEWTCWIMEVCPNAPFATDGYEWPTKLKDVERDLDWERPEEE